MLRFRPVHRTADDASPTPAVIYAIERTFKDGTRDLLTEMPLRLDASSPLRVVAFRAPEAATGAIADIHASDDENDWPRFSVRQVATGELATTGVTFDRLALGPR